MACYLLAIDQGTTSSRAIVFDGNANPMASSQRQFSQLFPKPGWVEHDPEEIWSSVVEVSADAISRAGLVPSDISAIGVTNQRETTILWDEATGRPVYNAIVWQSRQSVPICEEVRKNGLEDLIRKKTGLLADAYFSGTKISWVLRNIPAAEELMRKGRLRFGTVDSWLIHKMSGGRKHVTDTSNASRTLLYNIHDRRWDDELCDIFGADKSILPDVVESSSSSSHTDPGAFLGARIPIAGIAGDQQSALFGQLCLSPGDVKSTFGTGCFLLMNTGDVPFMSRNGLLTTIAWSMGGKTTYAIEGSVFVAGSAVQWIKEGIGIVGSSDETEVLASSLKGNDGVYFVPAFVGLGTPYWNQDARGTITGITRGTARAHIARATLESIAYQTRDVIEAMRLDCGISPSSIKVDGGMVKNDFLMGFLADICGVNVIRPCFQETTALGAALLAGIGIGHWGSIDEIKTIWSLDRTYAPAMPRGIAEGLYTGWKRSVRAALACCIDSDDSAK